ncbi:hypothetical protein I3760_07G147400 [Carya illinoinensis]|uniref:Uncharacterized protein n=1 Tax=Carya illinoinensis TaxID=32201 RepID=A0A922EJA9_CARIL|nr:hypothetical protein I3760_07G147400 [Carya illinoinensis]KAG6704821.1 hypothetical protein I3842_07G152100 [Carya illinoinensis]
MGAVCSCGVANGNAKVGKNISQKLEKIKGVSKLEGDDYSDSDSDAFIKTTRKTDSSVARKSLTSGSKPSTPTWSKSSPATPTRSKPSTPSRTSKIIQKGLGRAGERAGVVLDSIGTHMPKFNAYSGFGMASRWNKISIFAFEVANTIAKGTYLLQSLSKENIQALKKEILHSSVKQLVSTNVEELLSFAASDKRQEFEVFLREVIRFGDMCKDPQWHNMGEYFSKLDTDGPSRKKIIVDAETTVQELTTLAQHTSELYHELNAFERFEQDYRRQLEEIESLNLPRRGESLTVFQSELKEQRKLVQRLKKKSLWSKSFEEIVKKLLDVVTHIHKAIWEAFGNNGITLVSEEESKGPQRLGETGLALHYANIINQTSIIASCPTTIPQNMRDQLYRALPNSVKTALHSRILDLNERLSIFQLNAEMERTLELLLPFATNTLKAHQGFGWVGEWARASIEFDNSSTAPSNPIRLQTLYYADKEKTNQYILKLMTLVHHLIILKRRRDPALKPLPLRSPTQKTVDFHSKTKHLIPLNSASKTHGIQLSQEDKKLLDEVVSTLMVPGISKSQHFAMAKNGGTTVLSRSTGCSPSRETSARQGKSDVLDIMDGLRCHG